MTEITKQTDEGLESGWVFFDGECPMCVMLANRFAGIFGRIGYSIAPQQTAWVRERLGLSDGEPLTEVRVLSPDGQIVGGAEAVVFVAKRIWWAWPLYAFSRIPGVMFILRTIYRKIAANRFCISNACSREFKSINARYARPRRESIRTGPDLGKGESSCIHR